MNQATVKRIEALEYAAGIGEGPLAARLEALSVADLTRLIYAIDAYALQDPNAPEEERAKAKERMAEAESEIMRSVKFCTRPDIAEAIDANQAAGHIPADTPEAWEIRMAREWSLIPGLDANEKIAASAALEAQFAELIPLMSLAGT